jgi:hypothetical protein
MYITPYGCSVTVAEPDVTLFAPVVETIARNTLPLADMLLAVNVGEPLPEYQPTVSGMLTHALLPVTYFCH